MEKYFANYNQSLALKELGFNEPCFAYYQKSAVIGNDTILPIQIMNKTSNFNDFDYSKIGVPFCSAPLKSQVFEWFRKQGYDTKIHKEYAKVYLGFYWTGAAWEIVGNGSYEEAEEMCIDKLIEIVKNK